MGRLFDPSDGTVRLAPLIAGTVALAALSLLFPSSPTYDPWAWIVWGREVLHLDLSTVDGPSWKPLPVLFTTPFALFGDAAPQLWLIIARAGAIAAVVLAFAVGRRLGGVVAGGAAAGALALAPWFVRNSALGNSEGLMAACVLGAIDRHLAGKHRQAFLWGVAAALMRPEAWAFLGLYAAWLLYRERRAVVPVLAGGIGCLPILWFLPEYWGSGNFNRAADRAQQPLSNSAAFSERPWAKVFENAADMLTVPLWIGLGLGVALVVARRVERQKVLAAGGIALLALLWVAEVSYMTEHGYSGNQRYLIIPIVLAIVAASAGVGWLVEAVPRATAIAAAAGVVAAALFAAPSYADLGDLERSLRYQGRLPHQLADAIEDAGGADRLKRCGQAFTSPFLVPAVAWQLDVHTTKVGLDARPPAVVFRVKVNGRARATPTLKGLTREHTLGKAPNWRIVGQCR
ncbi:MAG TPA: hypothetical protein VFZ89_12960 [Solirubrobacteraceae bacterium]